MPDVAVAVAATLPTSKTEVVECKSYDLPKTMKCFVMLGIGKTGWIEKPTPECGPLDAICRPLALAPCTSDTHTVWAGALGDRHNLVLGHEAVGQVVKVGSLVKNLKPGDRVIVPAITPDWSSAAAQEGFPMHSNGMLGGWKFSNTKDGVFAEYFHVNDADANLAVLPDDIPPQTAVMLCDMITTGLHGAELAEIKLGDTVAVIGIGPVGLMSVAGAALMGASKIYAVGSRPRTMEVAKAYGATHCLDYHDGPIEEQILAANGGPVDRVIIAGGDSDIFDPSIKMLKAGGCVGNVSYLGHGNIEIDRLAYGVGMGHKFVHGGLTPGGRLRMEKLARLISVGRLQPEMMVTHIFEGLEKVEDALYLMKDKPRDLIKPVVVINYSD